jgi:hypothetical protein
METEKPKAASPSSMRLSVEGKRLQKALAEKLGISQKAVIELAIRDLAKKQHVK